MFQLAWPCDYIQCGLTRFGRPKSIVPNRLTVPSIRTTKTVGDPPCTNQIIPTIDGGRVQTIGTQKSTPSYIPRCQQQHAPRSESKPSHDHPKRTKSNAQAEIASIIHAKTETPRPGHTGASMKPLQDETVPGAPLAQCEEGSRRAWSSSTGTGNLPWPGRAAARGAVNPAGRVPGRNGRRDLVPAAGEIGLGLARGGDGRRGGGGSSGGLEGKGRGRRGI
jgi:hypothetical protein